MPKTVKDSQATITALMTPQDQNFLGYVFGGVILKLMDQIAYVSAAKHAGSYCVTAAFDRVDFKEHVHVGELLTMQSCVNFTGKTSMEVGIRVTATNPQTGKSRNTSTSYVTMIAIGKNGKPKNIPPIIPQTPEEKQRWKEGEKRYKDRKKRQK